MTEFAGSPATFELNLPPPAEQLSGDEATVGLLAQEEVRTGLQLVNDQISAHYRGMEVEGQTVHELFRGTTPDGRAVAVAEYVEGQLDEGAVDPRAFRQPRPILPYDRRQFVVFGYDLNGLPDQVVPLPQTPARQSRDGYERVNVVTEEGITEVAIPVSWEQQPALDGARVTNFRDAAFGERRTKAARESLSWLSDAAWEESRAARKARRDGKEDVAEAHEAREARMNEYYGDRLRELYDHPEWMDAAQADGADLLPGIDDYVDAHPELFPIYPSTSREDRIRRAQGSARGHARDNHVVDPSELEIIRETMMPDEPQTSTTAWGSYYRSGMGPDGERRAMAGALNQHRKARLQEVLGE